MSTCPHAKSMRDPLGGEKYTPRNTRPVAPSCPHAIPLRAFLGCRSPPASPGRRVTFQVRSSSLRAVAAPRRSRPRHPPTVPAGLSSALPLRTVRTVLGPGCWRRRSCCVGAGDSAGALRAGAEATWVLPPRWSAGAAARRRRAGGRRELGGEEGRRRAGVSPAWRGRARSPLP